MKFTILIVDDKQEMCLSLSELLTSKGYRALSTIDPTTTSRLLEKHHIDLIIMDIKMPKLSGIDLLKQIKRTHFHIPIIMITGFPSLENAIQAMKHGALNFYVKPLKLSDLLEEIRQVANTAKIKSDTSATSSIITQNSQMQEIMSVIVKTAPTGVPVIISGESGTGKELIANSLHSQSPRRAQPFITVNCAAIPENLLESELFGHEKGAFTDAIKTRKGKFELANGGTIFLDEIGDMNPTAQAKMLRVLQEKEFERVGGTRVIKTDARVISATNKDIQHLISQGTFREDLYYRLSVVMITLPPLRERKDDIIPLTNYFLSHFSALYGKQIQHIADDVLRIFLRHHWPGNIRELKNCMERAVIFCDHESIEPDHLPNQYRDIMEETSTTPLKEMYNNVSREMIIEALNKSDGVKQKAAELLKIHRKTLYNKMKELGL
jgi:DNA-binding NtrC family response regulator